MKRALPPLHGMLSFEVTARLGSVRRAAEELCVTPGATSRQIRQLEQQLGVQLFEREGRGIVLSKLGAAYYERIKPHFEGLRQAGESLAETSRKTVLNLRSYTTFATRWLIPRLTTFQVAHPEVDVRLSMSSDWAPLGTYDAAIRLGNGDWVDYEGSPLIANVLLAVCSPTLLEARPMGGIDDLQQQTLLATRHRPDDWPLWLRAAGAGAKRRPRMKVFESSAMAYQAAMDGQGIAVAQQELVRADLDAGRLVLAFPTRFDRGAHTYYLVYPSHSPKRRVIILLAEWLKASA